MKFLSAASTVALAGLLFLVPFAQGEALFKCRNGVEFPEMNLGFLQATCDLKEAKYGDPLGPNGEVYPTSRFGQMTPAGCYKDHLIQLIDNIPTYRIYQRDQGQWHQCIFQAET
ncbi:BgTH12-07689 [Blumeria graminis f. sp. triticale]|uniref:BgTH12-07689 n=1 Tax=Blumeria graminis f. sp. triticale TaxID=1689686 RepID=A0A9W4D986_BLUGR|nr:BgTH12-07689 [Blumeria graminis f. sp. triticale]